MSMYLVLGKSCTNVKEFLTIEIFTCTWGQGLAVAVRCSGSSTFAEILIFIIQITCFSFLLIEHDSSLVLLLSSGQSNCGSGLHAELVSEYFSGSYVMLIPWELTCCWWAIVCFTKTHLMLCSIAYFLAFCMASACEDDNLASWNGLLFETRKTISIIIEFSTDYAR